MKISEFIEYVQSDSKKRTGVVLADGQIDQIIKSFKVAGVSIVDCSDLYKNTLFFTDDQLIEKLRSSAAVDRAALIINMELFIAPRMRDGFLEKFIQKMAAEEPRYALLMLFYSKVIFDRFTYFYQRNAPNQNHTLNLSEENYPIS